MELVDGDVEPGVGAELGVVRPFQARVADERGELALRAQAVDAVFVEIGEEVVAGVVGGRAVGNRLFADHADGRGDFGVVAFAQEAARDAVPVGAVHGAEIDGLAVAGESDRIEADAGGLAVEMSALAVHLHLCLRLGVQGGVVVEAAGLAAGDVDGDQPRRGEVGEVDPALLGIDGQILDESALGRNLGRQFDLVQALAGGDVEAPDAALAEREAHVGDPQAAGGVLGDAKRGVEAVVALVPFVALHAGVRPRLVAVVAGDFDQLQAGGLVERMHGGENPAAAGGSDVAGADGQGGHLFEGADGGGGIGQLGGAEEGGGQQALRPAQGTVVRRAHGVSFLLRMNDRRPRPAWAGRGGTCGARPVVASAGARGNPGMIRRLDLSKKQVNRDLLSMNS